MDAILMSLMTALNEKLLINVYQRDTDDFYTGYVQALGNNAVILSTFSDAGIADGAVLIAFSAIDQVEFDGEDLVDMRFRIQVAAEKKFLSLKGQEQPLQFDPTQDLLPQLVNQVLASRQMVMVILADDDAYLEGQVKTVFADHFTLSVFNKFNYTDVRTLQVDFSDVFVVEFQGLDLHLETALVSRAQPLSHVQSQIHLNDGQLQGVLQTFAKSQALVSVLPKGSDDQFFVGTVRALNKDVVILALKDMAAQFGGYVLLRLPAIQSVTTASDYLQTIQFYDQWDQQHHFTKQPVLNPDREFDASDDLVKMLIHEAASFQRVIRVRGSDSEDHYLGYPIDAGQNNFNMQLTEEGETDDDPVVISYDQVQEIAFGHVYAYLQERQLH